MTTMATTHTHINEPKKKRKKENCRNNFSNIIYRTVNIGLSSFLLSFTLCVRCQKKNKMKWANDTKCLPSSNTLRLNTWTNGCVVGSFTRSHISKYFYLDIRPIRRANFDFSASLSHHQLRIDQNRWHKKWFFFVFYFNFNLFVLFARATTTTLYNIAPYGLIHAVQQNTN